MRPKVLFFKDRIEAGKKLAGFFDHINGKNAVVYALPRGGVKEIKAHYAPKKVIVAVPVTPYDVAEELAGEGAEVLSILKTKEFLGAIGAYYQNFSAVSDDMVATVLKEVKK